MYTKGTYLTRETRTLLTLMKFRAVGLMHAELSKNPLTRQRYKSLVEHEQDEQRFTDHVGNLLVETIKQDPTFSICLPPRLVPELDGILWAQVADWLIDTLKCEYNNFGSFRANRSAGFLRVEFFPHAVATDSALPESLSSTYGGEILADQYCRSAMDPIREQILDWPDFGSTQDWRLPLIATTLLTRGLNEVWRNFISRGILPARVEGDEDWVTLLAMGASYATYYAWVVACGVELSTRRKIAIEDIGTFEKTALRVDFKPTTDFLKLLYVNMPRAKAA